MKNLLAQIRQCTVCKEFLPYAPKPILRASSTAQIVIIGQAPGTKVHNSGIPWNDASGKKLREWLQMDDAAFYDEEKVKTVAWKFH